MKLFTYFSPSHKVLFEKYFKPSVDALNEFELFYEESANQDCPTGTYSMPGFKEETKKKIQAILKFMQSVEENEYFLYSDVDVIFLNKAINYLMQKADTDIVFQHNCNNFYCAGFMLIKKTEYTISLFEQVIQNLNNSINVYDDDQTEINKIIDKTKCSKFDNKIFHYGLSELRLWKGQDFDLPDNCIAFHACYTIGIDNKIKLLNYVVANSKILK